MSTFRRLNRVMREGTKSQTGIADDGSPIFTVTSSRGGLTFTYVAKEYASYFELPVPGPERPTRIYDGRIAHTGIADRAKREALDDFLARVGIDNRLRRGLG